MQATFSAKLLMLSFTGLLVAAPCSRSVGAATIGSNQELTRVQSKDVSISLTRLAENHRQYSLVVSDSEEHVVSGSFSVEQLQILRAIMTEALKFAWNAADAPTKDPDTTRFMDKEESAFIVDVQKLANQSLLFLTIDTETGRMTFEAGKVIRSTRREDGLFFDLLSRLDMALPKATSQPAK